MPLSRTALFTSPATVCEAIASLARATPATTDEEPPPVSAVRRARRRRRRSRNRIRKP